MIAVALAALLCAEWSSAAEPGYRLSTHMLDVSLGRPASDVAVVLEELQGDGLWQRVAERWTDANGRGADLLPAGEARNGLYRLRFETEAYFARQGLRSIYPWVEVTFRIEGDDHYHIPITMSPTATPPTAATDRRRSLPIIGIACSLFALVRRRVKACNPPGRRLQAFFVC